MCKGPGAGPCGWSRVRGREKRGYGQGMGFREDLGFYPRDAGAPGRLQAEEGWI